MDNIRNKYRNLIIVALVVLGLAISFVYNVAADQMGKTYQGSARESIVEVKKSFLKDTVNNVILRIERKQNEQVEWYKHLAEDIKISLENYNGSSGEMFLSLSMERFQSSDDFSVFIAERQTQTIIYSSTAIADDNSGLSFDEIQAIEAASPVFFRFESEEYSIVFYVTKEVIDEQVKAWVHDEIHSYRFSNDIYIWVNEVIDYNGGDRYAIRRIHPNLKDTEGMYLSTDMTDIAGNHPYLTELEGVRQDGELFFNYYFKKNNSDVISEKITYAKLYEEYDWIIAMGVHLDDVRAYADQTALQSERNIKNIMLAVAGTTAFLTAVALIFVSLLEKWYFKNTSKVLSDEIYRDSLTMAYNRRGAENHLKSAFSAYKITDRNAAIIMLDIDDFKKINDECGHDKGDFVLKQTAELLNRHIRSTDFLCRWGGDEFLIICHGLKEDDVIPFTDKLLSVVSELAFECSDDKKKRCITISMGVSGFINMDPDFSSAVIRADKALYRSKARGKNRVTVEL